MSIIWRIIRGCRCPKASPLTQICISSRWQPIAPEQCIKTARLSHCIYPIIRGVPWTWIDQGIARFRIPPKNAESCSQSAFEGTLYLFFKCQVGLNWYTNYTIYQICLPNSDHLPNCLRHSTTCRRQFFYIWIASLLFTYHQHVWR